MKAVYVNLARLILLAFLLRALIPLGYMPGQGQGAPSMTLCVSGLPTTVIQALSLDTSGAHNEPPMLLCAFGASISPIAMLMGALVLMVLLVLAQWATPWRAMAQRRAPAVRGPPVGSRAPPIASVVF
ncbi:hypothetical protein H0A71_00135 [Alcaligenaceae bacterium]|nr:hypothetical protein [Alcaligenaceae bacterium]